MTPFWYLVTKNSNSIVEDVRINNDFMTQKVTSSLDWLEQKLDRWNVTPCNNKCTQTADNDLINWGSLFVTKKCQSNKSIFCWSWEPINFRRFWRPVIAIHCNYTMLGSMRTSFAFNTWSTSSNNSDCPFYSWENQLLPGRNFPPFPNFPSVFKIYLQIKNKRNFKIKFAISMQRIKAKLDIIRKH